MKLIIQCLILIVLAACAADRGARPVSETISVEDLNRNPIEYARERAADGHFQLIQIQSLAPSVPGISKENWWIIEKYGTLLMDKTGDWGPGRVNGSAVVEFAQKYNAEIIKLVTK